MNDMIEVRFTVAGIPAPQGSKKSVGRGVFIESNPRTKPWRATVSEAAAKAMDGRDPFGVPCEAHVLFYFPRPKNHYGTGKKVEVLKDTAPTFHTSTPDTDKLQRALGDSFTGIVVRDDSIICHWNVWKLYGSPRCEIVVRPTSETFRPHQQYGPFRLRT